MKEFKIKIPKPVPTVYEVQYTGAEIVDLIKKDLQAQGNTIPTGEEFTTFHVRDKNHGIAHVSSKEASFTLIIKSF